MTAAALPGRMLHRKGLRSRMLWTLAGVGVVPFLVVLGGVFLVARHDVGAIRGNDLAREARVLADQLESQIEAAGRGAAGLASLPEVRSHLAGSQPYPHSALSAARRLLPGLRRLNLVPKPTPADAPVAGPSGMVSWGTEETVEYRIGVTDLAGAPVGFVEASFDLDRVSKLLDWYRKGERGRAVLFTAEGHLLAGPPEVPLPPSGPWLAGWTTYSVRGQGFFAGVTAVDPGSSGLTRGWFLALVTPASEIYGPFHHVSGQVAVVLVIFAGVILALAWRVADQFLRPILQLRNGAEIISRINLAHRISVQTGDELEDLAQQFNEMAQSLAGAYDDLELRVKETTRSLQEERNRLAAVLRTMAEGVVMTNETGEVLLMNPAARLALGGRPATGIGAPLGDILPADRLDFYLRRLRGRWDEGREAVEQVVFPLENGTVLRGSLAAVAAPGGARAGFLVVFRDTSSRAAEERKLERTMREMPELLRGPVAAASSLLETLGRHPEMPAAKQAAFLAGVREEVGRLSERLHLVEEASTAAKSLGAEVPSDPLELVQEAAAALPGGFICVHAPEAPLPSVLVEPYTWVACLAEILRWIGGRVAGWAPVNVELGEEDGAVVTALRIEGVTELDPKEIGALTISLRGEPQMKLAEAVRANRGELWTRACEGGVEVRLGLLHGPGGVVRRRPDGIADEQPEFYDFDLFVRRPAREPEEILGAALGDLDFVVFDSETTGLQPSQGDRIVSLSAVRVRAGRVLQADTFHTLVNPERPIPASSKRFHGIDDAMVRDAPVLADVLPRFYEYAGSAVLVAHNAAFDKKFLDMGATAAGLALLDNPVLDTLFLSYGIHRDFDGHNLDAIAERLGVTVEGRHTSLGDARATAEVFLKLIQLLAPRGIATLADAKAFCDRMLLLRWQTARF